MQTTTQQRLSLSHITQPYPVKYVRPQCARATHLLRARDVATERVVAAGALHVAADLVDLALQLVGRLLRAGQPGQVTGAVALNLHATQRLSASHSTFMPLKSLHISRAPSWTR